MEKKLQFLLKESARLASTSFTEEGEATTFASAPARMRTPSYMKAVVGRDMVRSKGIKDLADVTTAHRKEYDAQKAREAKTPAPPDTAAEHSAHADAQTRKAVRATQRLGQVGTKPTTAKGHVVVSAMHKKGADAHSAAGHHHLDAAARAKKQGNDKLAGALQDKGAGHFKMADRHDRFQAHHMDQAIKHANYKNLSRYNDGIQVLSPFPKLVEHIRKLTRVLENNEKKPVAPAVHKASSKAVAASEKLLRSGGGSEAEHRKHASKHHELAMQYHELGHPRLASYHTDYGYKHIEAGMKDPTPAELPKAPKDPYAAVESDVALEHLEPLMLRLQEDSSGEITRNALAASHVALESGDPAAHASAAIAHKAAAALYKEAQMTDIAHNHTSMCEAHRQFRLA